MINKKFHKVHAQTESILNIILWRYADIVLTFSHCYLINISLQKKKSILTIGINLNNDKDISTHLITELVYKLYIILEMLLLLILRLHDR